MTGHVFYTGVMTITALVALGLVGVGWRQRRTPPGRAYTVFVFFVFIWALFYALQLSVVGNPVLDTTLGKLSYLGIVGITPTWLLFIALYTEEIPQLNTYHPRFRRNVTLLYVPSLILLLSVFTNEWHKLHWREVNYVVISGIEVRDAVYGPLFWINALYAYVLMTYALTIVFRLTATAIRIQQQQAFLIVLSNFIPWVGNALFITRTTPITGLDLTPVSFTLTASIVAYVLVRYQGLNMPIIARDGVVDSMTDSIIIVDNEDRVIDVNMGALVFFQTQTNKVLGQPMRTFWREHPDVLAAYEQIRHLQTPKREREARMGRRADGAYVSINLFHMRSSGGRSAAQLIQLYDITVRKEAQMMSDRRMTELAILREIDAHISSTLNADNVVQNALMFAMRVSEADSGFISLVEDDKQRILQVVGNYPRHIVGERFPVEVGIVGRVVRTREPELIKNVTSDPDYYVDIPETRSLMAFPLISRDELVGVLNLETSREESFAPEAFEFVCLLAARIATAIENANLYTTTQRQLAELRVLYEQVTALEHFKTDMLRLASHDLRTPVNNIEGYLELIKLDSHMLSVEHQDFIQAIRQQNERMAAIISDIMSLEKMRGEMSMHPVDMCDMVAEVTAAYQAQAAQKNIVLTTDMDAGDITAHGDFAQLREALANLVNNALKYTPSGGAVRVSLCLLETTIRLDVIDTGFGIPAELQDQLFLPFSRINQDETTHIDGTGLGLHLVKRIVERHNGTVHFKSTYGQGSTFGFELPLLVI